MSARKLLMRDNYDLGNHNFDPRDLFRRHILAFKMAIFWDKKPPFWHLKCQNVFTNSTNNMKADRAFLQHLTFKFLFLFLTHCLVPIMKNVQSKKNCFLVCVQCSMFSNKFCPRQQTQVRDSICQHFFLCNSLA